jgi:hypothetical protein
MESYQNLCELLELFSKTYESAAAHNVFFSSTGN